MTTTPQRSGPRRVLRGLTRVLGIALLCAAVLAVGYAVRSHPRATDQPTRPAAAGSAAVTKGTVTERVQVSGTLGYSGTYPVIHHGQPGILTATPAVGSIVPAGGVLYAVANRPVRLLLGATPAYRDLGPGVSAGPDVRQLERNLVALGMDPDRRLTVDSHFTAATASAVRRWQRAQGLPAAQRTGRVDLGTVMFAPSMLRVGRVNTTVGETVSQERIVLTGTSDRRVVTAQVGTDRQGLVRVGNQVQVTLPGARPVPATVTAIGAAVGTPTSGGSAAPPTVPVTISIQLPRGTPQLDQAPVQVGITTAVHRDVLLVPVGALLARPGGGYQVRTASGATVAIEPGLFDDTTGLVEIRGAGVAVGQQVEVPAG